MSGEPCNATERWMAYRPDIRVLDCTIRDGGLVNRHQFDAAFARSVYDALADAGVDYVEVGYKADKSVLVDGEFGPWKFCEEDDLRRMVGDTPREIKIAVMADADRCDYRRDFLPAQDSVIDLIRVACYIHQLPTAIDMIKDAHDKGYETTLQLMAISAVNWTDVPAALHLVAKTPVDSVYIVDSFGSMYSERVRELVTFFSKSLEGAGKTIGFHGHNNLQLAFANTIEAIITGANMLDATLCGFGRGAGNCPMELLLSFLHNPKFSLRPVLQCSRDVVMPLKKSMSWGYTIPYALTGMLNQHPRDAIAWEEGSTPGDFVGFYDRLTVDL